MSEIFRVPSIQIQLSESEQSSKIQILRVGRFNHPYYGTFEITPAFLANMVKNFELNVRGVDLAIDYDHEVRDAAGWIVRPYLDNSDSELWAEIDWTPKGKQAVKDKEFRYISADFTENYVDEENGNHYGPTLFGAALTNRPFVKNMAPAAIEFNEIKQNQGDTGMNLKDLQDQNAQLNETIGALKDENKKLKEQVEQNKTLSEELKTAKEENKTLSETIEKQEKEAKEAAKKAEFQKLLSEGKAVAAQEEAFLTGDVVKFAELAGQTNTEGQGHGKDPEAPEGDNEDQILKLAEKKVQDKEADTIHEAISMVLHENPELK